MAIKPEDDIHRESCTKDEAVAKMLGWMRGSVRKRIIQSDQYGIFSQNDLSHLHKLPGSLEEILTEQRDAALQKLLDKAEDEDLHEHIEELDEGVNKCTALIDKCVAYKAYINDELKKGESSALKIDKQTTEETGITHITLISLDEWARKQFDIPIIGSLESTSPAFNQPTESQQNFSPKKELNNIEININLSSARDTSQSQGHRPACAETDIVENHSPKKKSKMIEQEEVILKTIENLGYDPKKLPDNPPGKPGVKAEIKSSLEKNPLFEGPTVFNKAWERLCEYKKIEYSKEALPPPPKNIMGDTCGGENPTS